MQIHSEYGSLTRGCLSQFPRCVGGRTNNKRQFMPKYWHILPALTLHHLSNYFLINLFQRK